MGGVTRRLLAIGRETRGITSGVCAQGEARGTENDRETENGERKMSLAQP